jgi:hypothetical protein
MPAHAGIQYAAALAAKSLALWNTGSRVREDDGEFAAQDITLNPR